MTTLCLVESPAKCATIEKYLGESYKYKCLATYGHFRRIASLKDIDLGAPVPIKYTLVEDSYKIDQLKRLKEEIEKSVEVILATDDDREGEAIAWHICDEFNLPVATTKRIVFHEITETAILNAMRSPTTINMNIVRAQQARQVLDLIVGYNISPILWKMVQFNKNNALSAGRCQTPALRLVYDNFKEFEQCKGRKVYNTVGVFTSLFLPFTLNKEFETSDDVEYFLENDASHPHVFRRGEVKIMSKPPPVPFTTSRLQQVSPYSPAETMKLCQTLYERGLITYMRTDSVKYSAEFVTQCHKFIVSRYGSEKYLKMGDSGGGTGDLVGETGVSAAHEAIRCTDVFKVPEGAIEFGSNKEQKMYAIIWKNAVSSLMSPATFSSFVSHISAFDSLFYKYTCETPVFPGWTIVDTADKSEKGDKSYAHLSALKDGVVLEYRKIESKQTVLGLKPRLTESKLVSLLEERGIGRPSTYASLVDKIQERNYVKKEDYEGTMVKFIDFELEGDNLTQIERERMIGAEKNKLIIQPVGIMVLELLQKHFDTLFNYDYTKEMEIGLDRIASDESFPEEWIALCTRCEMEVSTLIRALTNASNLNKISYAIDDLHTYIIGKNGPVIKRTEKDQVTFLPVIKNIDIEKLENHEYTLDEILESPSKSKGVMLGMYKGDELFVKKGKYGLYASYGENRFSLQEFGNRPVENIGFAEVFELLEGDGGILSPKYNQTQKALKVVREVSASVSIRKGKWGNYIFYKTAQMKTPQFFDLKTFEKDIKEKPEKCDLVVLKKWIKMKYNVS
jgi:DNA topoisomerase-1